MLPFDGATSCRHMGSTILEGDWQFYEGHGLIKDALFNHKDHSLKKNNVLTSNPELAIRLRGRPSNWLTKVSNKIEHYVTDVALLSERWIHIGLAWDLHCPRSRI